jgi:hypothetical protein
MRVDGIDADTVDANPLCGRRFVPGPKLGQLAPSTTREIEHIEKEDDRLVLLEGVGKSELVATCGRQLEFRRLVPDSKHV